MTSEIATKETSTPRLLVDSIHAHGRRFSGIVRALFAPTLCLVTACILAGSASAQPSGRGAAGGAAKDSNDRLWITTIPIDETRHALIVADPVLRHLAIYHVDTASGTLTLKSTRDIGPDMHLGEFNAQDPKPSALRKMLEMRAVPPREP